MRRAFFSAIVAMALAMHSGLASADDRYDFSAYGLGYASTCKDFVEISADPEVGRRAFAAWIQGFLSGVQFGASKSAAVKSPALDDITVLMRLLTQYCSENPQIPFIKAALLGIYFEAPRRN